ncbi:MAG TPA: helix-turn-helix domain-containing protein [Candidatus Bathyarchaeia archaeon]|nr:helix-turn-helix domain-containing protein [Candidatus Bathyarchaeia archaeon]
MTAADVVLKEAGFTVSQACRSRPSCFDFAACKKGKVVFIKVQTDVGSLSLNDAIELKSISEFFQAKSILLGERSREKPLEDDTIYYRYDTLVFTPKTLENLVLHKIYPLIQASPGGYYVEIDGEKIKRRRQQLGLSVGEIAKSIGISRRTLYGYESGMAKAPVTVAYNLISTLGIPVAKSINIFENTQRQNRNCFLTTARRAIAKNTILQKILKRFTHCRIATVKKAPFDFVLSGLEDKMRIVGGVADTKETELDQRVDEILSISRVVQAHPILITEGKELTNKDILCIPSDKFSKINNPKDLIMNA